MAGRRWLVVGLVVAVFAAGVVVAAVVTRSGEEDILLESAASVGKDPFTATAAVSNPTTTQPPETTPPGVTTTTALYGGSGSQKVCDPESLIRFLQTHADKATAWVGAQNSDPTFKWSKGDSLSVADIADYIHELIPTFLAEDTRVTNHGFKNGKATPHQSVLQAGTAVLVDRYGIPRARCACGNPLIPPKRVRHPRWKGDCWYDTTTTTVRRRTTTSSSTSTSTSSSTSTTVEQPVAIRYFSPGSFDLALASKSHRCGDKPYCAPPGCTFGSTTTIEQATTTSGEVTTTTQPNSTQTTITHNLTGTTSHATTTVHQATVPQTTSTIRPATTTTSPNQQTTTSDPGKP